MLLEARAVTKAFGSFKAVDAASVTLEQGDILGLIGPNGAGKSTFFNCLTGDLQVSSGNVLFEGHDITDMTPEGRAQLGLARTFQVPQTFEGMSVLENVMIGAFLGVGGALLTVILGAVAGSIIGLAFIKFTGKDMATYPLPFGSFLGAAAFFAAIEGQGVIGWYAQSLR